MDPHGNLRATAGFVLGASGRFRLVEACSVWVVLETMTPFRVPNMVRHPFNKDPQRDPNLENYRFVVVLEMFRLSRFPFL